MHDVYVLVVRAWLTAKAARVDGLHELLHHEAFVPFRARTAFDLLREFPLVPTQYLEDMLRLTLSDASLRTAFIEVANASLSNQSILEDSDRCDLWLSAAYLARPDKFKPALLARSSNRSEIVWRLRNLTEGGRAKTSKERWTLSIDQIGDVIGIIAHHFKSTPHPKGGWSGDTNPWDASDYMRKLVERLSSNPTPHATRLLVELTDNPDLESYRDHLKHALASQRVRHIDSVYDQPNWRQVVDALENKAPANAADLQALVMAQLIDLRAAIAHSNTDIYKRFWNEDSYGRIDAPKPEESCRDVLVDLLRQRLQAIGLVVEPEGHMAKDKRVDISITSSGVKSLIELKRDYHAEVWTAAEGQLERLYSRDLDASGYGIYGVFWFGDRRPRKILLNSDNGVTPKNAPEMENMIRRKLSPEKRLRIEIVVLDVSGTIG